MNERDFAAGDGTVPPAGGSAGSALAAVGAVLFGFVCLVVGGAVSGALMFANLKLAPALPLFLPATLVLAVAVLALPEGRWLAPKHLGLAP